MSNKQLRDTGWRLRKPTPPVALFKDKPAGEVDSVHKRHNKLFRVSMSAPRRFTRVSKKHGRPRGHKKGFRFL